MVEVYKYIVVGNSGVGKSSLVHKYLNHSFSGDMLPTISIEFATKTVNGSKLQIWDTAGLERFSNLAKPFYRGARVAMCVYDITSRASFFAIASWVDKIFAENPWRLPYMGAGRK